jgi:hypothetical protein
MGKVRTTWIMMATVHHVTSRAGRLKFQATWFLLDKVYICQQLWPPENKFTVISVYEVWTLWSIWYISFIDFIIIFALVTCLNIWHRVLCIIAYKMGTSRWWWVGQVENADSTSKLWVILWMRSELGLFCKHLCLCVSSRSWIMSWGGRLAVHMLDSGWLRVPNTKIIQNRMRHVMEPRQINWQTTLPNSRQTWTFYRWAVLLDTALWYNFRWRESFNLFKHSGHFMYLFQKHCILCTHYICGFCMIYSEHTDYFCRHFLIFLCIVVQCVFCQVGIEI